MIYETIATFLAWNRRKWHNGILCSIFTFFIQKCPHRKRPLLFFYRNSIPIAGWSISKPSNRLQTNALRFQLFPSRHEFVYFFLLFLPSCANTIVPTYSFLAFAPRNRILCKRRARIRVVRISSQNLPPKTSRAVRERIGKISISHL